MNYHAPSKKFVVEIASLESAAYNLRDALRRIRTIAGLPLDRYQREGPLTDACFAQLSVIEAAEAVGIDLGVSRHKFHELDLRPTE